MTQELKSIAGQIVEKDLSNATEAQIKSELKVFITDAGSGDLLIDDDFATLFEIAVIFSDLNLDATMIDVNEQLLDIERPVYKRIGKIFRPRTDALDKIAAKKVADVVCGIHLDLHYQFKDKGIAFIDDTNIIITYELLRSIEGMPAEYSGKVVLHRIKNQEQLEKTIDSRYLKSKVWKFVQRTNRCEGTYFTTTEFIDLISNRKIITFDKYE